LFAFPVINVAAWLRWYCARVVVVGLRCVVVAVGCAAATTTLRISLALVLDFFKQSLGMRLLNRSTGRVLDIDRNAARLARMRRRVYAWSQYLSNYTGPVRRLMLTLTYRPGEEWAPNDIRDFMLALRSALGGALLAYAWVAEVQARGAVHYHVYIICKEGTHVPYPDEIWVHGSTNITTARNVFYITTYIGKEYQKDFSRLPAGARLFAVWVSLALRIVLGRYEIFRLSALPVWLAELIQPAIEAGYDFAFPSRLPGGGWLYAGLILRSPWIVVF